MFAASGASVAAPTAPAARPKPITLSPSRRTKARTSRSCAPTAVRIANSRLRCPTVCATMPKMPRIREQKSHSSVSTEQIPTEPSRSTRRGDVVVQGSYIGDRDGSIQLTELGADLFDECPRARAGGAHDERLVWPGTVNVRDVQLWARGSFPTEVPNVCDDPNNLALDRRAIVDHRAMVDSSIACR